MDCIRAVRQLTGLVSCDVTNPTDDCAESIKGAVAKIDPNLNANNVFL